jgi:hypothetical protein
MAMGQVTAPAPAQRAKDPFGLGAPSHQAPQGAAGEVRGLNGAGQPELSRGHAKGDGGEALLREALSKASAEVVEKIAWEVIPPLAETIIREQLERLIKEREGKG